MNDNFFNYSLCVAGVYVSCDYNKFDEFLRSARNQDMKLGYESFWYDDIIGFMTIIYVQDRKDNTKWHEAASFTHCLEGEGYNFVEINGDPDHNAPVVDIRPLHE